MASTITRPHILLLHSSSPSLKLNLKPSSPFLRYRNLPNSSPFIPRRVFCSTNSTSSKSQSASIVNDLLDYLNESWTHFHATGTVPSFHSYYSSILPKLTFFISCVAEAKRQLIAAGFHLLNENEEWNLKPGGRYFFTRNMSCLVAFAVGQK